MALYAYRSFQLKGNRGLRNDEDGEVTRRTADSGSVNGSVTAMGSRGASRCRRRHLRVQDPTVHGSALRSDRYGGFRAARNNVVDEAGEGVDDPNWVMKQFWGAVGDVEGDNLSCYSAK